MDTWLPIILLKLENKKTKKNPITVEKKMKVCSFTFGKFKLCFHQKTLACFQFRPQMANKID